MDLHDKAQRFRGMHVSGQPLILFNVWDVGSATAVADAGARALATGSWSVAAANGFPDGEHVPLVFALDNVRRIAASTELPVSLDIESGYGADAVAVGSTIAMAAETGVVGFNIEDSFPPDGSLRTRDEQVARLRAARRSADDAAGGLFINARTDVFFQATAECHDDAMLHDAIERGKAFADAGADGFFVPGLVAPALIERLTRATSLPVNIMATETTPSSSALASLGVARISHGPGPYVAAMRALSDAARHASALAA